MLWIFDKKGLSGHTVRNFIVWSVNKMGFSNFGLFSWGFFLRLTFVLPPICQPHYDLLRLTCIEPTYNFVKLGTVSFFSSNFLNGDTVSSKRNATWLQVDTARKSLHPCIKQLHFQKIQSFWNFLVPERYFSVQYYQFNMKLKLKIWFWKVTIENIWSTIGTAARNGPNPPRNPAEMADALRREWDAIDDWTIRRLIFSMRRRCSAVINANGGNTKYWSK